MGGGDHGICERCLTPLDQVDGYDIEAALRGEEVRIKRLICPVCLEAASEELLRIMTADNPEFQALLALVEQGVDPDDLPGYVRNEAEQGLRRLFSFLDDASGEE